MYASVKRPIIITAGIIILSLLAAKGVSADSFSSNINGITISPPMQQITIGPGLLQAYTNIYVTNNSNQSYTAKINLYDFSALNDNGGISLEQAGSKFGLADWMSLPGGNSVTLAKGQTYGIKVVINNRDDLTPGGHYGAIALTSTSAGGGGNNGVSFNQQLASLLFVNKSGGDVYGLKLTSLTRDPLSGLPNDITMSFKSTGNVYVIPHGYVEIFDPRGKLVEKGIINQQDTIVMQGSSRQFITLMKPVSNPSLKGRYKIVVYYRHDNQNNFDQQTYYFNDGSNRAPYLTGVILLLLLLTSGYVYRKKTTSHTGWRKR